MQRALLVAAVAAASLAVPVTAAADPVLEILDGFVPHRAVYDLELERADAGSSVAAAAGRLVFEFTGSVCEGYAVNSRFVTRLADQDGTERLTDLRSATFETVGEAPTLSFRNRTFVNQVEQDETAGKASRTPDGIVVDLDEPTSETVRLDTAAVFPTYHVGNLIRVARAGTRIHEADVYDGAEDGKKAFATTTVIGPGRAGRGEPAPGEENAMVALHDDLSHWRMTMSYFDVSDGRGELTPSYQLGFILYENGVSRDLTFDYGAFALKATLSELEILESVPCE